MADTNKRLAIDVDADTGDAEKKLGHLSDTVEEVEKADPKIEATADTRTGEKALDDLFDKVKNPPKVVLTVDDDALDRAHRKVTDKVSDSGKSGTKFGEGFIRDLGGSLGGSPAVGVGADLAAGIEKGLDTGLVPASLAGPLIAALGIGTVAITAATTIWSILQKGAQDYKKEVQAAKDVQEALFAGQNLQAIKKFDEKFGGIVTNAETLGKLDPQDVFKFLTGQPNKPVEDFITSVQTLNGETVAAGGKLTDTNFALGHLVESLIDAKNAGSDATKQLEKQGDRQLQYLKAVNATNDELFAYAQQAAPDAKRETILYIAELNKIPPSKITEILALPDEQQLAATKAEIDRIAKDREVMIHFQADIDQWLKDFIRSGGNVRSILGGLGISGSAGTTIINVPPTLNPNRVLSAVGQGQKRNGGLRRG